MAHIATTIEQSRELIKLGLNPKTADMYYVEYSDNTYLTSMDKEFDRHTDTYAWSLSGLLELMPFSSLHNLFNNKWRCDLHYDDGEVRKFGEDADSPIDAAFETMKHVLENKSHKSEEEQLRELANLMDELQNSVK